MVLIFWLDLVIMLAMSFAYGWMPDKTHIVFFLKDSGQAIPLVVESCIRFINLYGKHHHSSVCSAHCGIGAGLLWEKMIFSVILEVIILSLLCSREWLLLRTKTWTLHICVWGERRKVV